jgi:hypothetical protein
MQASRLAPEPERIVRDCVPASTWLQFRFGKSPSVLLRNRASDLPIMVGRFEWWFKQCDESMVNRAIVNKRFSATRR